MYLLERSIAIVAAVAIVMTIALLVSVPAYVFMASLAFILAIDNLTIKFIEGVLLLKMIREMEEGKIKISEIESEQDLKDLIDFIENGEKNDEEK